MPNYNKVILMGNLTRDPEMKYSVNQTPIVKFGLAINRKTANNEETAFIDCTAFGKQAELLNQHFHKGKPIHIEGRLHFSKWTAQDGTNRSKLEVIVERVDFCDSGQQAPQQGQPLPPQQPYQPPPQYPQQYQQGPPPPPPPSDDIPF